MAQVRRLAEKDLEGTVSQEIGKEVNNPSRKLKLCTYAKRKDEYWYRVVVEIQGEDIQIWDSKSEEDARSFFYSSYDIFPRFWSPRSLSHLTDIFTDKVLAKLVEVMKNSWSVAHMCVSLPLPEDTMMILLASDSFKDHFTSTHHPKGYTLLHLAVEINSATACRAIMRCSDQWLYKDPGLFVEDIEGVTPIQKAVVYKAWACLDYLAQSQRLETEQIPQIMGGEQFQRATKRTKQNVNATRYSPIPLRKVYTKSGSELHKARDFKAHDVLCVKTLLVFNAEVSMVDKLGNTALELAEKMRLRDITELLTWSINFDTHGYNLRRQSAVKWPPVFGRQNSYQDNPECPRDVSLRRNGVISLLSNTFEKLKDKIDRGTLDQLLACAMETFDYSVQKDSVGSRARKGDRVLCLDGGGIKGLILIELLSFIEKITNKKIVDLFDWIVGTSTGGILALAIVYTNLSLGEMRCLYFKLKDKVFSKLPVLGLPHSNTEELERILKDIVGEYRTLGSKQFPKVLITATDAEVIPFKLTFFNNFESGPTGKEQPIWKAARATSAAPVHFKHFENYIDGGIKANNPSMSGLTRIHQYYTESGKRNYKISCVVSLGCGMFEHPPGSMDVHKGLSRENFTLSRLVTLRASAEAIKAVYNLLQALIAEVAESDGQPVADTKAFCQTNKISYYRLSPKLEELVELDEKNDRRLVDMIILTKQCLHTETDQLCGIKRDTDLPEKDSLYHQTL
ncbi:85/88 kDa calcium-independent phospholipase A2-like isoform X2 [Dysidea avara]|uniref:85/88 kDa calcium-independent phospholipase A2-like isoform X2 n=1 Tax=Dysidea avara TaxID=196820 RepID=UPI003324631E